MAEVKDLRLLCGAESVSSFDGQPAAVASCGRCRALEDPLAEQRGSLEELRWSGVDWSTLAPPPGTPGRIKLNAREQTAAL